MASASSASSVRGALLIGDATLEPPEISEKRKDAELYLERHALLPILTRLVEKVSHDRPANPRAAMAALLRDISAAAKNTSDGKPTDESRIAMGKILYREEDMRAIFRLTDTIGRGTITQSQFSNAARHLGLSNTATTPSTTDIEIEVFCREMLLACGKSIEGAKMFENAAKPMTPKTAKRVSPGVTQVKRNTSASRSQQHIE